jgi:hypothetical protein
MRMIVREEGWNRLLRGTWLWAGAFPAQLAVRVYATDIARQHLLAGTVDIKGGLCWRVLALRDSAS